MVRLVLTAEAPDEATAQRVTEALRQYWQAWEEAGAGDMRHWRKGTGFVVAAPWEGMAAGDGDANFTGTVQNAGRRLVCELGQFRDLETDLAALLAHLRALGCTSIEYGLWEERQ
jgi:hypothetical protein